MKPIIKKTVLVSSALLINTACFAGNPGGATPEQAAQIASHTLSIASHTTKLASLEGTSAPALGTDLSSTEGGFVACTKKSGGIANLIISSADYSDSVPWAKTAYENTETSSPYASSYYDGATNTSTIVSQNGSGTDYAAGICDGLTQGGKTDWYLPSIGELTCLYNNRGIIKKNTGDLPESKYWSSTESPRTPTTSAKYMHFTQDTPEKTNSKSSSCAVRCVRTFTP